MYPNYNNIILINEIISNYRNQSEPFQINLTASCNFGCECDVNDVQPVCGANGLTYFSPCHAGCTDVGSTSDNFTNCACKFYFDVINILWWLFEIKMTVLLLFSHSHILFQVFWIPWWWEVRAVLIANWIMKTYSNGNSGAPYCMQAVIGQYHLSMLVETN